MKDIDPAFATLRANVLAYIDVAGRVESREHGVRMDIEELTIETPVELDVVVDETGMVAIGCAPPLYRVETTVTPVFHRLRFTATVSATGHDGSRDDD